MSKKITLLFVLTLLFSISAFAQKKKKKDTAPTDTTKTTVTTTLPASSGNPSPPAVKGSGDERSQILTNMYALGFRYYDLQVSQMALYEMIARDLGNVSLRDSLALLYYNMGKFGSAIAVATDVLGVEKNNLAMLEIRALSNESLRTYDEALRDYEKLNLLSPNSFLLYKIASLQYNVKRNEEAKTNIEALLKSKEADDLKVSVSVNQIEQQEVPMKAAVQNLKGLLYKEIGNKEIARASFTEALKIFPGFKNAKANLDALDKPVK